MSTFKLTVKLFFCILLALVALVLIVPQMMELDKIKKQVVSRVEQQLESKISIGKIKWEWLPLPHVTLLASELDNDDYTIVLPVAQIYPGWRSLLSREVDVTDVHLQDPEVTIKQIPPPSRSNNLKKLPPVQLTVDGGSLHFAENSQLPYAANKEIHLSSIAGELTISSSEINLLMSGQPSFGEHFSLDGMLSLDDGLYDLRIDSKKLRLHDAFHTIGGGRLLPVESVANFKGRVKGKKLDNIELEVVGDIPCLLTYPEVEKNLISCGFVDFVFKKADTDMSLRINDLEMLEPGLKLTGEIKRQAGKDNSVKPIWTIDLAGEDIDLTKIRKAVLTLWPDNIVAREVGEIVKGGKAGKASYKFMGPISDLKDIRNMTITADETDATIVVPYGNLVLQHAAGRMLIKDGILTVQQASADLGKSSGRNCELSLGMTPDDYSFSLDVDVEGELAELPDVLRSLVYERSFLEQLAKVSNISGHGSGHLHVGENLNDIKVILSVTEVNGTAEYEPLRWPVTLSKGQLKIMPGRVEWQDIEGSYGRHRIRKTGGNIHWNGKTAVELTDLDATLLASDLDFSKETTFFSPLQKAMQNVSNLAGDLVLADTRGSGLLDDPDNWKFRTDIKFDNVVFNSPHTPAPIHIKKGHFAVTEKDIKVAQCSGTILDSSFDLQGKLLHNGSNITAGDVVISGIAEEELVPWIKGKALVPPPFFPAVPFEVEDLHFAWDKDKRVARGSLYSGLKKKSGAQVNFSVDSSVGKPLAISMAIKGTDEQADIIIDFLDNITETFSFSWKGSLSEVTLDALLENKDFLQGNISGDFQLVLPADPDATKFNGELFTKGLSWHWDGSEISYIDIDDMHLVGSGEILDIKQLLLRLADDEMVAINGPLHRSKKGLELNVDLQSLSLSKKTIFSFLDDLEIVKQEIAKETGGENRVEPWSITGVINFNLQEFVSGTKAGEYGCDSEPPLTWNPLRGTITLFPGWKAAASITSGRLCCLYTTGEWFSDPELGLNSFNIISACETTPQFELILPCLGYPQDLIEGEFSLSGRLVGTLKDWRDGYLDLHSSQGRILRMTLLSKIFKIVNVTDIFTSANSDQDGQQKKGFAYKEFVLKTKVKENDLIIEQAFVKGDGLNLYAEGKMNINTYDLDMVVLVAPLKTLDAIISKVPLVGRILSGKTGTFVAIPVSVKGNILDPKITVLDPGAIGQGIFNIIKRTLLLPFDLLGPIIPDMKPDAEE
jgi:hypothetical protein